MDRPMLARAGSMPFEWRYVPYNEIIHIQALPACAAMKQLRAKASGVFLGTMLLSYLAQCPPARKVVKFVTDWVKTTVSNNFL
ncbi:hypothetical protein LI328DRAFT_117314 [Trichoderma asperelloides]|nr:hypothetical protein LI328DRAFT_117314 [Trichoderma asperelloides]